jgi:hypothetical protein
MGTLDLRPSDRTTSAEMFQYDDDNHHHIDGVRLRLWTAATNGPIVRPPCDTSMENHSGMMLTEENSRFVHQSSLAILPAVM